jgi:hypothetical protein
MQSTNTQEDALLATVDSNPTLKILLPHLLKMIKATYILQCSTNQLVYRLVEQGLEERLRTLMMPRAVPQ